VTSHEFAGEFNTDCQEKSVPQLLTALVQMILEGPSIDNHTDSSCVPAALSLSQLLSFDAVKHARKFPPAAVVSSHLILLEAVDIAALTVRAKVLVR